MLAKYYRLRLANMTDQDFTYNNGARILVRMTPWKLVDGVLTYGTSIVLDDDDWTTWGAGEVLSASTDEQAESTVVDNTSNLYWGIKGYFEMTADANSTDGSVYLYLEESDDNTNWPSDCGDFSIGYHMRAIAILVFSTGSEDQKAGVNFEI